MRDELLKKIQEKGNLPPLPDILLRLEAKIEDPGCDINDVAGLIETEPVLAGRLMTLSNSVFFGGGREKVLSVRGAVLRLGLKLVLDLAYTLEMPRLFSGVPNFDQKIFWKHSLGVGILSRFLADRLPEMGKYRDLCYMAGLMHDIGILVFNFLEPNDYPRFLLESADSERSLDENERDCFGIDHAELGSRFIQKWWPVDEVVIEAVARHHEILDQEPHPVVEIVHLANAVANLNGMAHGLGAPGQLDRKSLISKGMALEDYQGMVEEADKALQSAYDVLMH